MLRTIVVDDEPKARRVLSTLLEQHCEGVELIGMAEDVPSAVKLINKENPDLVFLDIEMPGYTGFQLLDFFDEVNFQLVFTTAYSEYALQAFQVSAVDYILKPIEIGALRQALEKVKDKITSDSQQLRLDILKENLNPKGALTKIALPVSEGFVFVHPEQIIYLKADGAYTNIILDDGRNLLVSKKIKSFDVILNHPCFFKTHRSYLVNLNRISDFKRQDGGYIIMDNGDQVSIARDRKDAFLTAVS